MTVLIIAYSVKKKYNATKSDKYPLNENIRHERKGFWKSLLDGGFISKEKYETLNKKYRIESGRISRIY